MESFSDPRKVIVELSIAPDAYVVDFGAGSGAYTFAAAEAASDGKVYAVEVQKELVSTLKREAEKKHLGNVEVVWGNVEEHGGTKLKDESVDLVLICNVLFQAEDKNGVAHEAWRILRHDGRVAVIEWADSFGGLGPHVSQLVKSPDARRMFENERFLYEKPIFDAGAHHHGFITKKRNRLL
ncbi:MAG: hypothetical protein A2675_01040 [Candidatus Yonathbacteria bacterium RIFCSPHIGHO2_01_FULL_51_10]|uniref:Methyltransferase domain-containing protein n=1 Tax=Candidatus Yonathbacteria bacterium RIFCSPHIGHO2_01_FULL_51_10 TaxID=1802723 RepID=A0A1G2S7D5_9BACT|nr:MAG: hypothetical protein A2675_01040 [Candidatus Yonathbacteria bacterium RIFCSPHIGHO2_01_FULL_51_10]